jgi:hypothetical protein
MNARGTAVVALGRGGGRVDLVQRPPEGPWSEPLPVVPASSSSAVSHVVVALNAGGDIFLGWGMYAFYGAYLPHDGAWSDPVTISPDAGVDVLEETFAEVAPNGDVVVLWTQEARPLKVRSMVAA